MTHHARTYFLVKDLLDELRTERNEQGTGVHLRVQELLRHLPDDLPDEKLLLALAPILAKSPREQTMVYEKFKVCQRRADEIFGEREIKSSETAQASNPFSPEFKRLLVWFWVLVEVFFSVVGLFFWLLFRSEPVPLIEKEYAVTYKTPTSLCLSTISELKGFGDEIQFFTTEPTEEGIFRYDSLNEDCFFYTSNDSLGGRDELYLNISFKDGNKCDLLLTLFVGAPAPKPIVRDTSRTSTPDFIPRPIPHDHTQAFLDLQIRPADPAQKWLAEHWPWLRWLIFALCSAILYFLWQWWAFRRRKIIADTDRFNQPPYIWNIEIEGAEEGIVAGDDYQNLLQTMRRRAATDSLRLDLPRSIRATAESGGQPTFFFRPLTQPVDYLFLLDRQTEYNHRAQLFDALFRTLRAQELYVERFFYDSDLRVCFNEAYPDGLALDDIAQRYGQARLIVVGTGLQLLHPLHGHLEPWAEPLLKNWKERALLTPRPAADWARNERRLAELFTLLPATLQSLGFWTEELQHGEDARFERWREHVQDAPGPIMQPDDEMPLPMLLLQFPREVVRWVAACAIFPGLHWDLTLWLGRRLTADGGRRTADAPSTFDRQPSAVSLENLLKIFRIRWFVEGKIPDTARVALLDWLEKEDPALVPRIRGELAALLEQNPPPADSSAWIDHRLAIVLNRWLSETDKKKKAALEKELAPLLPRTEADFTVLKYLNQKPSPLHFEMPRRLRKFVYRGGFRALGFSGSVWSGLAAGLLWLAMAAALFFWKPASPDDGCRGERVEYVFDNQKLALCLGSPLDSLLWLERQALDTLEGKNYAAFDSLGKRMKQLLKIEKPYPIARRDIFIDWGDGAHSVLGEWSIPSDSAKHVFDNFSAALQAIGATYANQNQRDSACLFFQKAIGWDASGWDFSKEKNWCAGRKTTEVTPPRPISPCRQVANVENDLALRSRALSQREFDQISKNQNPKLDSQTFLRNLRSGATVELLDSNALTWKVRYLFDVGYIPKFYKGKLTLAACDLTWTVNPDTTVLFIPPGVVEEPKISFSDSGSHTIRLTASNATAIPLSKMIHIPGGTFTMGCTAEQGDDCVSREKPTHQVTLSDFDMGKTEVTNEQYAAFLNEMGNREEGGREWLNLQGEYEQEKCRIESSDGKAFSVEKGYEKHPVIYVSWYGAKAYADWLSTKVPGKKFRLPTEAEWEYAARGGNASSMTKFAGTSDEGQLAQYANFCDSNCGESWKDEKQNDGFKYTAPVGKFKPNGYGLHDMSGNVWEWCQDWYDDYPSGPQTHPKGPDSGDYRVFRGGSWDLYARYCRVSYRSNRSPADRDYALGFRLVRQ